MRWKKNNFRKFIKFSAVGVINVVVTLAVYYILLGIGVFYIIAYIVGYAAGLANAYLLNSRFVFNRGKEKRSVIAFLKMVFAYLSSMLLSVGIIWMLVDVMSLSECISPFIKLLITVPMNYLVNKLWVFRISESDLEKSK